MLPYIIFFLIYYFASTSLPSLNVITVAAFSGLPFTNLNSELEVTRPVNEPVVNAKIKKQIANFKKEYNYTYSGMLKTLIWWFDVKKNSIEKANGGIGIVPFVYQEAWNYYYTLYLAEVANSIEDIENYTIKTQEITIPSPRIEVTPPKLFNMDKWEEENVN